MMICKRILRIELSVWGNVVTRNGCILEADSGGVISQWLAQIPPG